jgi:opacity protein-like surface antigen
MRRVLIVALGLLSAANSPASGQEQDRAELMFAGLLGAGSVGGERGLSGGLGASLGNARYVMRAMFELHLLQPRDSDYSWDAGLDGAECRDDRSGTVVANSLCTTDEALAGLSTEASFIVPAYGGGVEVGVGYRFGAGSTPYGVVGYSFRPEWQDMRLLLRALAGEGLLGVQAVATLPFRRR